MFKDKATETPTKPYYFCEARECNKAYQSVSMEHVEAHGSSIQYIGKNTKTQGEARLEEALMMALYHIGDE